MIQLPLTQACNIKVTTGWTMTMRTGQRSGKRSDRWVCHCACLWFTAIYRNTGIPLKKSLSAYLEKTVRNTGISVNTLILFVPSFMRYSRYKKSLYRSGEKYLNCLIHTGQMIKIPLENDYTIPSGIWYKKMIGKGIQNEHSTHAMPGVWTNIFCAPFFVWKISKRLWSNSESIRTYLL